MTLLDEIHAKCSPELIAAKEHGEIARIVSIGRARPSGLEVGNGLILETIGLEQGNALLDALYGSADFRHVKPLLEQGRLVISSPMVLFALQMMVSGGVITQASSDSLCSIAVVDAPVSTHEVVNAMEGM